MTGNKGKQRGMGNGMQDATKVRCQKSNRRLLEHAKLNVILFSTEHNARLRLIGMFSGYVDSWLEAKVSDKWKVWPDDGARGEVRGSSKLFQFILRESWISVPSFIATHPIVVDMFHSNPQMGSPKSLRFIPWRLWMSVPNYGPIHSIDRFYWISASFYLLVAL